LSPVCVPFACSYFTFKDVIYGLICKKHLVIKGFEMAKEFWTSADIQKVFRFKERAKSIQTLFTAEARGEIPQAERIKRGSVNIRQWRADQIPHIGERFGFLKKPDKRIVLVDYAPKGGVLKTGSSFNLGKIFALNNLKTLLIDLEPTQGSLTDYTLPKEAIESLEQLENLKEKLGLYHFFFEKAPLKDVIQKTSLPTLDIIPGTAELAHLEHKIWFMPRREYLFKEKLLPLLDKYDVIIYDTGANFNQLLANAICTANNLLVPVGCEPDACRSLDTSLEVALGFINDTNVHLDNIMYLPTLLEKTNISQQIYAKYMTDYGEQVIPSPIRRNVKGQEARILNLSVIEYSPTSELAQDYYDASCEVWKRIIDNGSVI
jgi:chromosome partitioning protein